MVNIICKKCKEKKPNCGRGLCRKCYHLQPHVVEQINKRQKRKYYERKTNNIRTT